jgi:hypothetical protein
VFDVVSLYPGEQDVQTPAVETAAQKAAAMVMQVFPLRTGLVETQAVQVVAELEHLAHG